MHRVASNRWDEIRWRGSGHHRGAISGGAAFTVAGIERPDLNTSVSDSVSECVEEAAAIDSGLCVLFLGRAQL